MRIFIFALTDHPLFSFVDKYKLCPGTL